MPKKKKLTKAPKSKESELQQDPVLFSDIQSLIDQTRQNIARTVNEIGRAHV